MNNGLIALLNEEGRTTTVVGAGWSEATAREHFERLLEQAVGQIVVSGTPLVVCNIAESPPFTDWSVLSRDVSSVPRSFVGVPIRGENRTIGTIMIERLDGHSSPHTLDEDAQAHLPGHPQNDCHSCTEEGDGERRSRGDTTFTHRYHHRCLHAGDPSERSIDHQFHQLGVEKIGCSTSEDSERIDYNRRSCQQPAQSFCTRDTKWHKVMEGRECTASGIRLIL